jgi:4-amino-4-deoxy-L-arabinose transferase-like glycosyltransferase
MLLQRIKSSHAMDFDPAQALPSQQDEFDQVGSWRRIWIARVTIFVLTFAALFQTRRWLPPVEAIERINVVTAREIRQQNYWLFPTLNGDARLAKPPVAAWASAAAIRESTLAKIDQQDPSKRQAAIGDLIAECRLPAIIASSLLLVAVFELGRAIGGARLGVLAAAVAGSSVLFLRQSRLATTDIQLALWVTVTNALIARALFQPGRRMQELPIAIALGLAVMSKGPVALVQTLLPAGVFLIWHHRRYRSPLPKLGVARTALGLIVFAVVAGWWYAWAILRNPHWSTLNLWFRESLRYGTNAEQSDNWYKYATALIGLVMPWSFWAIAGVIALVFQTHRKPGSTNNDRGVTAHEQLYSRLWLIVTMVVIPLAVMSLFREKHERYLLPILAPAAVVAAQGLIIFTSNVVRRTTPGRVLIVIHGLALIVAIGLICRDLAQPMTPLSSKSSGIGPPQRWHFAAIVAAAGLAALAGGWVFWRRRPLAIVPVTLLLVAGLDAAHWYDEQRRPLPADHITQLTDIVWQQYPDADLSAKYSQRFNPLFLASVDMSLYMNRPVPWVADWPSRGVHAQIVLMEPLEGELDPPEIPPGWRLLARLPDDRRTRYLCLLPPA